MATPPGSRHGRACRPRMPVHVLAFGHRLRQAGLLGSMGRVASSVDNALIESFWSTMQRELLDTRIWDSPERLGSAIFEWIEAWYNPHRWHTAIGMLSPVQYE